MFLFLGPKSHNLHQKGEAILKRNYINKWLLYYIPSMNIHEHSKNVIGQLVLAKLRIFFTIFSWAALRMLYLVSSSLALLRMLTTL